MMVQIFILFICPLVIHGAACSAYVEIPSHIIYIMYTEFIFISYGARMHVG